MKRVFILGVICFATTSANAGWFSDLFKKESEPQTLAQACNIDEITAVCPEIILGQKTLVECLTDNVKTVSQKCVDYVKKAVSENSPEIAELKEQIVATADTAADTATAQAADAGAQIKEKVAEKIDTAKIELAKKLLESATTAPDAK